MWPVCLACCIYPSILDSVYVAPVMMVTHRYPSPTLLSLSLIRWHTRLATSSLSISTASAKTSLSSCKPGPMLLNSVRYHTRSGHMWAVLPVSLRLPGHQTHQSHWWCLVQLERIWSSQRIWVLTKEPGKRKATFLALDGRVLKSQNGFHG